MKDDLMNYSKCLQQSRWKNRRLARGRYENFMVTSFLLPRRLHQPFYDIYSFCRTADDIADESCSPQEALDELKSIERDLIATFDISFKMVEPERLLFVALADTVHRFRLRPEPFFDLLKAFRQDQVKGDYRTEKELLGYCEWSANPVGRILLQLIDADSNEAVRLSDSICTGLQLVNFLQGVAEDLDKGRIYLPMDQRSQFGVDLMNLKDIQSQLALQQLIQHRCNDAKNFFEKGKRLKEHVPKWFSPTVRLIIDGGVEAIRAIEEKNYDVLSVTPKVSKAKQLWLLSRAVLGSS